MAPRRSTQRKSRPAARRIQARHVIVGQDGVDGRAVAFERLADPAEDVRFPTLDAHPMEMSKAMGSLGPSAVPNIIPG